MKLIQYFLKFSLLLVLATSSVDLGPLIPPIKLSDRYYIWNRTATFTQALGICQSYGMRMAVINSENVTQQLFNAFLRSTQPYTYYWIAGVYQSNNVYEGWTWATSSDIFNFTNWAPFQPQISTSRDNCIRWPYTWDRDNGIWESVGCSDSGTARILCEYSNA